MLRDLPSAVVKTGMLATGSIVEAVVAELRARGPRALVVDPVLVSSSGCPLLETDGIDALRERLVPLATVITPNLSEAERLCGVATATRAYVWEVEGTGAVICDTRKTLPGWRVLDKYAVRCGGGSNHRDGLHDAVLIKDNHLAGVPEDRLSFAVFDMLNRLPAEPKPKFVEAEAQSLAAFTQLLKVVGVDIILLDNFPVEDLLKAVELRKAEGLAGKIQLEASGGITLKNVRAVAETGVERISVGAITHSAASIDLCLERI